MTNQNGATAQLRAAPSLGVAFRQQVPQLLSHRLGVAQALPLLRDAAALLLQGLAPVCLLLGPQCDPDVAACGAGNGHFAAGPAKGQAER